MSKKLWRVSVDRTQYQEIYVLAETSDEAEEDAIELAESDPTCWQTDETSAYATEKSNTPNYTDIWTGGPEGRWVSSVEEAENE